MIYIIISKMAPLKFPMHKMLTPFATIFSIMPKSRGQACWGRGGGLVDRAADSDLLDPSPFPEKMEKENKNEAGVGP